MVYKSDCASCNACYMGETALHLLLSIKEHLKTDGKTQIYQHLSSNDSCFSNCSDDCFPIFDNGSTKYQLMIKEALYIKW